MDPIAAFGLFCNICTTVDAGIKSTKAIIALYDSTTGFTRENERLKVEIRHLTTILDDIKAEQTSLGSGSQDEQPLLARVCHECYQVALKIEEVLEKCQVKTKGSKKSVVKAWLRSKQSKSELNSLQSELQTKSACLKMTMDAITREGSKFSFKTRSTEKFLTAISAHLTTIKKEVERLCSKQSTVVDKLDALIIETQEGRQDIFSDIKKFTTILEAVEGEVIHSIIMRSLRPPSLHQREDDISERYRKTFEWILRPHTTRRPPSSSSAETKSASTSSVSAPRDNVRAADQNYDDPYSVHYHGEFVDWLRYGSGVFHIAGKPGSGKSTLLKFLANDDRVQHHLQTWATSANKQLVFSKFFFWRYGADYQKSARGLLHGLLYDMCVKSLRLTQALFPDLWGKVQNSSQELRRSLTLEIRVDDIQAAFKRLCSDPRIHSEFRVCLFIDGLDEFAGQEPTYKLAEQLRHWTEAAPATDNSGDNPAPFLKLCVSSREEHAIMNVFRASHQVHLQELTRRDIKDMLSILTENKGFQQLQISQPQECTSIVVEIAREASGVFLWVKLILNQLEEELASGYTTTASLRKIIQTAPRELDEFLREIFNSVPKHNRLAAYFIFSMGLRLLGHHLSDEGKFPDKLQRMYEKPDYKSWHYQPSMPAYGLGAICDTLDKSEGIEDFRDRLIRLAHGPIQAEEEYEVRCEKTESTIKKLCRGLLEVFPVRYWQMQRLFSEHPNTVSDEVDSQRSTNKVLRFSHRSIPEILFSIMPARAREYGFGDIDVACAILSMHTSETSAPHNDHAPARDFVQSSMCHIGHTLRQRQLRKPYATKILILLDSLEHAQSLSHLRRCRRYDPKWSRDLEKPKQSSGTLLLPDRDHTEFNLVAAVRLRPSGDMLYSCEVNGSSSVLGMAFVYGLYEYIQWVLERDERIRNDPVWTFLIFLECPSWLQKLPVLGLPHRPPPFAIPLPPDYNKPHYSMSVWELRDFLSRENVNLESGISSLDVPGFPLATRRWWSIFVLLVASLVLEKSIWPKDFPMWDYIAGLLLRNCMQSRWLRPAKTATIVQHAIRLVVLHESACHGVESTNSCLETTNQVDSGFGFHCAPSAMSWLFEDKTYISLRDIVERLQPPNSKHLLHLIDSYGYVEDSELDTDPFSGCFMGDGPSRSMLMGKQVVLLEDNANDADICRCM